MRDICRGRGGSEAEGRDASSRARRSSGGRDRHHPQHGHGQRGAATPHQRHRCPERVVMPRSKKVGWGDWASHVCTRALPGSHALTPSASPDAGIERRRLTIERVQRRRRAQCCTAGADAAAAAAARPCCLLHIPALSSSSSACLPAGCLVDAYVYCSLQEERGANSMCVRHTARRRAGGFFGPSDSLGARGNLVAPSPSCPRAGTQGRLLRATPTQVASLPPGTGGSSAAPPACAPSRSRPEPPSLPHLAPLG